MIPINAKGDSITVDFESVMRSQPPRIVGFSVPSHGSFESRTNVLAFFSFVECFPPLLQNLKGKGEEKQESDCGHSNRK